MVSGAIGASLGRYPDEIDLATISNMPQDQLLTIKGYVQKGRFAAKYGWIIVSAILLVAALLGSDRFKGFFAWLGTPLLLAGGILLCIALKFELIKDMLWASLMLGKSIPDYLSEPVSTLYNELLTLISSPMMTQAQIVLGVGVIAVIAAFVFRKKKGEETDA